MIQLKIDVKIEFYDSLKTIIESRRIFTTLYLTMVENRH